MLKALATAPGDYKTPDTKHSSFKARTTGVSNPVRSPSFRTISVSVSPATRLRRRCSSRYLRISPLHREFPSLPYTYRRLSRDHALTEIYSFICEKVTEEPAWHERYFGLDEETAATNAEATIFLEALLFR